MTGEEEDDSEETYDPALLMELQTALGELEARVRRAVGRLAVDNANASGANVQSGGDAGGGAQSGDDQQMQQGGGGGPAFESVD